MLLVTKKINIALKKFLHTYSFYTIEEYLSPRELRTVSQVFIIVVC